MIIQLLIEIKRGFSVSSPATKRFFLKLNVSFQKKVFVHSRYQLRGIFSLIMQVCLIINVIYKL